MTVEDLYFRYHLSPDVKPLSNGLTVPQVLESWTRLLRYLEPGETASVDLEPRGSVGVMDVLHSTSAMFTTARPSPDGSRLELELDGSRLVDAGGTPLAPFANQWPEGKSLYEWDADSSPASEPPRAQAGTDPAERRALSYQFPAVGRVPRGPLSIEIRNVGSDRASVWLVDYPRTERMAFVEFVPVLSAKWLISNQTFRRLFRSETVPASETLQVRDLAYVFTDLKDSTLMYDSIGDANAYDLVRRHFDALVQAVANHLGSVTKTIGDAVMATFVTPADAVGAALDMLRAIDRFNRTITADLIIKIGIHRGRSIAVTLNDRIDFFGQDVNIASRVQKLASAGEIALTGDVYDDPAVSALLTPYEVISEPGIMRGVKEAIPVYRVRPLET